MPEPRVGDPKMPIIRRVLRRRRAAFRRCFSSAPARDPSLGGKVVVRFVVAPSGEVRSAEALALSSLRDRAVQQCLRTAVLRTRFPAGISQASLIVTYPFVFRSRVPQP